MKFYKPRIYTVRIYTKDDNFLWYEYKTANKQHAIEDYEEKKEYFKTHKNIYLFNSKDKIIRQYTR